MGRSSGNRKLVGTLSPDRRLRPASRQSRFDRKALLSSNVLRSPPKHLSSRRDAGLPRRFRPNAPSYSIRFQQVLSPLELDLPDQTALSGTVRPGKNRQNRHASGSMALSFPPGGGLCGEGRRIVSPRLCVAREGVSGWAVCTGSDSAAAGSSGVQTSQLNSAAKPFV